jgi:trk system potassium uptake protein TrkH
MRYKQYLLQRYRAIFSNVGLLTVLLGALHLLPLALLPFFPGEAVYAPPFVGVGLALCAVGFVAHRWLRPQGEVSLTLPEAMVVVLLVWLIALVASALPFMPISGLTFTQAMFESTSGWTGTGLSVVVPEETTYIILFHRSLTQLWGGAGFAIIALSAISSPLGAGFSAAEGRTDQLAPHVRRSASIVLYIYFAYLAFGIVALKIAGMNWFDAVNHAFTSIATGGFSTRNTSIAYYDSIPIEAVTIVLMFLGSINFVIAYTAIRGRWRSVVRSGEVRLMFVIVLVSVVLVVLYTTISVYSPSRAVRVAVFEVFAAITSTGLTSTTYRQWNDFGLMMLALLMIVGGGIGSTSGGIKLLRVYVIYKAVTWEIRKAFMPPHMVNEPAIQQGERRDMLSDRQTRQVLAFLVMFIVVFLFGCGVMMLHGYRLQDAVFETASAIGNAGLSTGVVQPTMPDSLLWSFNVVMLLGRLEFFAVIIGVFKLLGDGFSLLKPIKAAKKRLF